MARANPSPNFTPTPETAVTTQTGQPLPGLYDGPSETVHRRLAVKELWLKGNTWAEIGQWFKDSPDFPNYGGEEDIAVAVATINTDIKVIRKDLRERLEEQGETHAALAIARYEMIQSRAWGAVQENKDEPKVGFDEVKYMGLVLRAQDSINRVTGVTDDASGQLLKPRDVKIYNFIDTLPDPFATLPVPHDSLPPSEVIDVEPRDVTDDLGADQLAGMGPVQSPVQ